MRAKTPMLYEPHLNAARKSKSCLELDINTTGFNRNNGRQDPVSHVCVAQITRSIAKEVQRTPQQAA
jgi:hypothetical protein